MQVVKFSASNSIQPNMAEANENGFNANGKFFPVTEI